MDALGPLRSSLLAGATHILHDLKGLLTLYHRLASVLTKLQSIPIDSDHVIIITVTKGGNP